VIGAICPNPMVEMAKGVKSAGSAMWVGIGKGEELKETLKQAPRR
jgi:hypothetical protein